MTSPDLHAEKSFEAWWEAQEGFRLSEPQPLRLDARRVWLAAWTQATQQERKRCARVAEQKRLVMNASPMIGSRWACCWGKSIDWLLGYDEASKSIATAIRQGTGG